MVNISTELALSISSGLHSLDGYERIAKDGEREKVIKEFYKLGGGLRMSIAKNLNILGSIQSAYQKARDDILRSMADRNGEVPRTKLAEFTAEERKLLDAEHNVDLCQIDEEELRLDINPIPASVLSLIHPILNIGSC